MNAKNSKGLTTQEKWIIVVSVIALVVIPIILMSDIPFMKDLTIKVGEKFGR